MTNAHDIFRMLRGEWFDAHLMSHSHEREWETEEQERLRAEQNARTRFVYDKETEALLRGEGYCVAPTCPNDLRWSEEPRGFHVRWDEGHCQVWPAD